MCIYVHTCIYGLGLGRLGMLVCLTGCLLRQRLKPSFCCTAELTQLVLGQYNAHLCVSLPRPSSYPLLGPKYLLYGTIYPQLRVQGGSWYLVSYYHLGLLNSQVLCMLAGSCSPPDKAGRRYKGLGFRVLRRPEDS